MFKLFRDSIFRPRRIIAYRQKSAFFMIVYSLILAMISGICVGVRYLSYTKTTYNDRFVLTEAFDGSDAHFSNYSYYSTKSYTINVGEYVFGFVPESRLKEYITTTDIDFYVCGNKVYETLYIGNLVESIKVADLTNYSEFENVDLSNLTVRSEFYSGFSKLIKDLSWKYALTAFSYQTVNSLISLYMISLLAFVLALLFYQAGRYMKKGQLFKMVVYGCTLYSLAESVVVLFGLSGIIAYIIPLIALIPEFILEREILMRIRLYQFSQGLIKDEELAAKLKELNDRLNERNKNDKGGEE